MVEEVQAGPIAGYFSQSAVGMSPLAWNPILLGPWRQVVILQVVDGNQDMTVGGNRTVHVMGDFDETVDGTETRTVTGAVTETFSASETR